MGKRIMRRLWARVVYIALMAPLLAALAGCVSSGAQQHSTYTFAGPRGQWIKLDGLTGGSSVSIAPSDPRVVYEVFGLHPAYDVSQASLRRTDDDGKTWHTLTIPLPQGGTLADYGGVITYVDPVNPAIVFLAIAKSYPKSCPTWPADGTPFADRPSSPAGHLYAGYVACTWMYRSADSGEHWTEIALPRGGAFRIPMGSSQTRWNTHTLHAQDNRLFALDGVDWYSDTNPDRLIVSDDQGATWRTIDDMFIRQRQEVFEYMPTPSGSTLFAITVLQDAPPRTPLNLWRSDDGGASWHMIRTLPEFERNDLLLAPIGSSGQYVLYLDCPITPQDAQNTPPIAMASTDGGATWKQAPQAGLPPQDDPGTAVGIAGVLSDGSLLVQSPGFTPQGPTNVSYYRWKPGDAAWTQFASPAVATNLLLVSPAGPDGPEALWSIAAGPNLSVSRYILP
ncbi:MAG: hypothetical protein OJF49_000240 [Ktedonobacterales bacterium]|jgi:hypothetical protein|nr:MAG: hypothetical protein OJF49_000240 [Ktedonobacterales bacterium]